LIGVFRLPFFDLFWTFVIFCNNSRGLKEHPPYPSPRKLEHLETRKRLSFSPLRRHLPPSLTSPRVRDSGALNFISLCKSDAWENHNKKRLSVCLCFFLCYWIIKIKKKQRIKCLIWIWLNISMINKIILYFL
jgi:hypothetical protein